MSLEELRRQYTMGGLEESSVPDSPTALFDEWLKIALDNCPQDWVEPYAMTLATSGDSGDVSARIVLLRGHDEEGFVFYTNYESAKGQQLAVNSRAALVFYWGYLERQVRVTGTVEKIGREKAERYFHKRPRGSQIGAVISRQSEPIADRGVLEKAASEYSTRVGDGQVPLPDFWGGYRVAPTEVEFWQGRESRLHDRLSYIRDESGGWTLRRLSP